MSDGSRRLDNHALSAFYRPTPTDSHARQGVVQACEAVKRRNTEHIAETWRRASFLSKG